jgi:hypothetical protein
MQSRCRLLICGARNFLHTAMDLLLANFGTVQRRTSVGLRSGTIQVDRPRASEKNVLRSRPCTLQPNFTADTTLAR